MHHLILNTWGYLRARPHQFNPPPRPSLSLSHTHTHTHTHTQTHECVHACVRACVRARVCLCVCVCGGGGGQRVGGWVGGCKTCVGINTAFLPHLHQFSVLSLFPLSIPLWVARAPSHPHTFATSSLVPLNTAHMWSPTS
jgi:hypothetical protein